MSKGYNDMITKVNSILSQHTDMTIFHPDYHIRFDLAIDSLDIVEVVLVLEEEFAVEISDKDVEYWSVLKDVYETIWNLTLRESYNKTESGHIMDVVGTFYSTMEKEEKRLNQLLKFLDSVLVTSEPISINIGYSSLTLTNSEDKLGLEKLLKEMLVTQEQTIKDCEETIHKVENILIKEDTNDK